GCIAARHPVQLSARVTYVVRSRAGLTKGDVIEVQYEGRDPASPPMPGSHTPQILQEGAHTIAFLKREGAAFVPDSVLCFSPRIPGYPSVPDGRQARSFKGIISRFINAWKRYPS